MRYFRNFFIFSYLGVGTCGCADDALDLSEKLVLAMQGVFEAPVDADGNAEPRFQEYVLTDVVLTASDGTETSLYKEDEPTELRIVNRSQIIHEGDLSDFVDTTFTTATVRFEATVVGGSKYEDEMNVTLVDPDLVIPSTFTVEQATVYRLSINVQWKNTVMRDEEADPPTETMSAPTFALELGKG